LFLVVVYTVWKGASEGGKVHVFGLRFDEFHFQEEWEVVIFVGGCTQLWVSTSSLDNNHNLILVDDTQVLKILNLSDVLLELDWLWLVVNGVFITISHGKNCGPNLLLVSGVI